MKNNKKNTIFFFALSFSFFSCENEEPYISDGLLFIPRGIISVERIIDINENYWTHIINDSDHENLTIQSIQIFPENVWRVVQPPLPFIAGSITLGPKEKLFLMIEPLDPNLICETYEYTELNEDCEQIEAEKSCGKIRISSYAHNGCFSFDIINSRI